MKSVVRLLLLSTIYFTISLGGSAQEQTSYKTDKPQKGEGLYAFLLRNNLNPSEFLNDFLALNENKNVKEKGLLLGIDYALPNAEVTFNEPLFGTDNASFKLETNSLKGATYYLVSGHGGPDPGALGKYGDNTLSEDEYAYDITLRLAKKLMENGAKVHMIIQDANDGIRNQSYLEIDDDETCLGSQIPLEQNDRLKQRTNAINDLYTQNKPSFQRCVIIHVDSRSKGKEIDVFFYHAPKSKSGEKMAHFFRETFDEKYQTHQPTRGYSGIVKERNLYLLKKTYPTAVFIELGNIRNFRDQQRFIIENNRQALANWMCESIIKEYETVKK